MSYGMPYSLAAAFAFCLFAAAAPAQTSTPSTAPAGLVHKSSAYWSGYKTDIIRQVFDGAFSKDMDRDLPFRLLFDTYVGAFSDNCSAYLPSQFDKRTITETLNGVTVSSREIDIDYKFLPKYDEYSQGGGLSVQQSVKEAVAVFNGSLKGLDPIFDITTFFSKESCKSAAMRQFGENLLRGANGKPSLQTAGASIAGAGAESEFDAPVPAPRPGPSGPLAAGCNAFFRDPKTSRFAPRDPTGYCKCLSDGYQGVMTLAEDDFYGKNFGDKFWRGIAQPTSTDPAWPRLNPVAVSCMQ